jgi:uncharacterized protein DUF3179
VWTRTVNGRVLHFYLAGINNQNFLMRDKETGTWWQQITGKAIYGPLNGASLELVPSDELTFGEWKAEVSGGKVLAEVPKYGKEYESNWEPEIAKLPIVISFPGTELKSRDVVVGLQVDGPGRAYPWETILKQSPVMDRVNGMPILVTVGPDKKSFRVFVARVDGKDTEFFLKSQPAGDPAAAKLPDTNAIGDSKPLSAADPKTGGTSKSASAADAKRSNAMEEKPSVASSATSTDPKHAPSPDSSVVPNWTLLDTATASEWNFQGCAIAGPAQGKCLDRVPALKDFWFDWRNYHPNTTIYRR